MWSIEVRSKLFLLLAFFFSGCATPIIKVNIPNMQDQNTVTVTDLRPRTEKENQTFSLSISSKAYGLYRRGDAILDPTAIRILQHRVHEKFSHLNTKSEIKIHHFIVYMNLKSELRRGVFGGTIGGIIGAGIAAGTQRHGVDILRYIMTQEEFDAIDKEYERALYSNAENPGKASVYVVYLDAEIDGKRTFVKTMTPFNMPKENTSNSHVFAVETAIEFFLEQFNNP